MTNFLSEPCKNAITILNMIIQEYECGTAASIKSLQAFTGIKPKQVDFVVRNLMREGYITFNKGDKLRPDKFLEKASFYNLIELLDSGVRIGNLNVEMCPIATAKQGFSIPNYEHKIRKAITEYLKSIPLTRILAHKTELQPNIPECCGQQAEAI